MYPHDQINSRTRQEIIDHAHTLRARAFRQIIRTAWRTIISAVKVRIHGTHWLHPFKRSA